MRFARLLSSRRDSTRRDSRVGVRRANSTVRVHCRCSIIYITCRLLQLRRSLMSFSQSASSSQLPACRCAANANDAPLLRSLRFAATLIKIALGNSDSRSPVCNRVEYYSSLFSLPFLIRALLAAKIIIYFILLSDPYI